MTENRNDEDTTRTELSADPADYLTGPTSGGNTRQGGTTRDGSVAYTDTGGPAGEQAQQVQANTQAAQTEGNADTTARAQ
jgi:hypothetical protein